MGITRLDNLDFLCWIGVFERCKQAVKDAQVAMPVWIVTQADDVKVGRVILERVVK